MLPHPKWEPPYPAYAAAFAPEVRHVVMAYYGVSYSGDAPPAARAFAVRLQAALQGPNAPAVANRARHQTKSGRTEDVFILYWLDPGTFQAWQKDFDTWWHGPARLNEDVGYWCEIFSPPLARLETLISSETPAGLAEAMTGATGPIREHAYWGAMRDRIPLSASDALVSAQADLQPHDPGDTLGKRLRIVMPENVCLIRSGQNFTDCGPEEADIYHAKVGPVLAAGMTYLRDHPLETGCLSCRFMSETAVGGAAEKKTFGLAYFLSMAHLEAWAANHPTHLAIFRTFHELVRARNFVLDLKLWHEVAVIPQNGGVADYINCPPDTGLLPHLPATPF
jgi:aldoxime dehydratase